MIVGKRKLLAEIKEKLTGYKKILILGCGECVTVCHAGGEREVAILKSELDLAASQEKVSIQVETRTVKRQCDQEFLEEISSVVKDNEIVVSLGCGAGAQTVAAFFPKTPVIPGLNTRFIGAHTGKIQWEERCRACGDCSIHIYGGFCPLARCSKSLLNGPCGGSSDGHCEVNPDLDCIWQKIIDRMTDLGMLDRLMDLRTPRDWRSTYAGGPRRQVHEEDIE